MRIAIHQPQFIPWLGYFDKMDKVDVFVLLDNVQFKKNEYQNRNRIKTHDQWIWLSVPVSFNFGDLISKVRINNQQDWGKKHLQTLLTYYGKAPCYREYLPPFAELYHSAGDSLADLNMGTIELIRKIFAIDTEIVRASDIPGLSEEPTARLLDICRHFKADTYLAGAGGKRYMECDRFKAAGLKLLFQNFVHPEYPQINGPFVPYMSALDYILNTGGDFTRIRQLNQELEAY